MKVITVIVVIAGLIGGVWYFNQDGQPSGRPRGGGPVLVVAEKIVPRQLVITVEALGTANANESVTLTASLTDTVRRVNFEDGDYVEAGAVLVELTSREEEAQLAEARANLDEARRQLQRFEDLDRRGIAAASDVDQARAMAQAEEARLNTVLARLEDRLIRAPFSGVLGFRAISPGTLVGPSEAITTIDDVSQIKLDFTIPETALSLIEPGDTIYAHSASWGEREFDGQVRVVASRVDPVTRAVVVRAIIDNDDRALRPGMLLTVRVVTEEKLALMVPERSVVQVGRSAFVYVVGPDMLVRRQSVQLGTRQAGRVEITAGLQQDDLIVTDGVIKLRDGLRVQFQGESGSPRLATPGSGAGRPPIPESDSTEPPGRPDANSDDDDKG